VWGVDDFFYNPCPADPLTICFCSIFDQTVQTIAFLAWLNRQNQKDVNGPSRRPHLIVVPASVLSNWMNEFRKFAPDMIVYKYHGNQVEREEIRELMDRNFVSGGDPLDAVLTTFSYFSSDSNKGDR
jgi:SNF2 family DNA or RNA helicase